MRFLALDIGEKRIGLAFADSKVRIAVPRGMVSVDGNEHKSIFEHFQREKADALVVGFPRSNAGLPTKQTDFVKAFVGDLMRFFDEKGTSRPPVYYQDESLTSVLAEERLSTRNKTKTGAPSRALRASGAIDAEAAALFLQDFLESADFTTLQHGDKYAKD